MLHRLSNARSVVLAVLLLGGRAFAQVPVITGLVPLANARTAPRTGPLTVTFSQPLTAASAGALQVFSARRGGRRTLAAPATVSGNTLRFMPPAAQPFMPGETVQATVTTAAASASGPLARARVTQFTAAVGGTGTGTFSGGSDPAVVGAPCSLAVGDVDGDGDLDFLVGEKDGRFASVIVYRNSGSGTFIRTQGISIYPGFPSPALGDVDGDGDLDLVCANSTGFKVEICLNNGSGSFSGSYQIGVSGIIGEVAMGDVDGDGDLDVLFSQVVFIGVDRGVGILLNNGSGVFSNGSNVPVRAASDLAMGDLDGDGDLDLVSRSDSVNVRLNDGSGNFSGTAAVVAGRFGGDMVLGDLDGDGDLDLVTGNDYNGTSPGATVPVRLNDGSGNFSGTQNVPVPHAYVVTLGDLDADGDLDLVTSNRSASTASVRLNDGNGNFSGAPDVSVGISPNDLAVGDVDGDGDLDLLTSNWFGSVNVRLNGGTVLAAAAGSSAAGLALFPNPARGVATLAGAPPHAPLTVLDALGRLVLTAKADANGTARLATPAGLQPGVYVVRCGARVQRLTIE